MAVPQVTADQLKKTVKFQVVLSPIEHNMLEQLHDRTGLNKSHLVRIAIAAHYAMAVSQQPQCANGRACVCPQLQVPTQAMSLLEVATQVQERQAQLEAKMPIQPSLPVPPQPLETTQNELATTVPETGA